MKRSGANAPFGDDMIQPKTPAPLREYSDLLRSEDPFRALFEHHPDALTIHDREGRYVRVNAAMSRLTGYATDELIGRTPASLTGVSWPDDERMRAAVMRGETIEFERALVTGFCGILRDVTGERRRERESVRESKRVADLYRVAAASAMPADDKVRAALRESDTVGRIGGDEFVVLQPEIASVRQAEELAAKLVALRDDALRAAGHDVRVRLSVGVAVYPVSGAHPSTCF
jgi:PAS domain-containing protein